jgi:hypothetical protein
LGYIIDTPAKPGIRPIQRPIRGRYIATYRFQSGSSERATFRRPRRVSEVRVTVDSFGNTQS